MKLQLLSDLHIEFWSPKPNKWQPQLRQLVAPECDVLALLGDVHVGRTNVQNVLNFLSQFYDLILYVPGNHEYYGHTIHELDNIKLPPNVRMLNPASHTYKGITFAGATLWSSVNNHPLEVKQYITDFRKIRGFSIEACRNLNENHFDYLNNNKADVVLTHFIPEIWLVDEKWQKDDLSRKLNDYFVGRCTPSCAYHLFGHTHDSVDITRNGTRYLANPHGYAFDPVNTKSLVLDL